VLFVQRSVPANSIAELVAYARANPGKLNYGTTASNEKMLMEMFKRAAGLDIVEIPYKGGAPRTTALMANEVQLAIGGTLVMKQQGFDAKIKPMMAFGPNRSGSLPDVPTSGEMGFPALSAASTLGLWAPMNTERDIITRLNRIAVAALAQPAMKAKIRDISGFDAGGSTPDELRARSKGERDFYVQAAGLIKLQAE
jgi:tripartite-type tricarboxylate transporter receptor subunit TctC